MQPKKTLYIVRYKCEAGNLSVGEIDGSICLCDWTDGKRHQANLNRITRVHSVSDVIYAPTDTINQAIQQLEEYFAGNRRQFTMPLLLSGTPFQQSVWEALHKIPYGTLLTYCGLASITGHPTAARAVAGAVASNALSILLPCHRIIGSDGSLTGYAGGIAAKLYLLNLEKQSQTM